MSSYGYYNPRGQGGFGGAVAQNVERVYHAVGDIANQREFDPMWAPTNGAARRVNAAAAQGADLTQQFDPFGNNRYTDASNPWAAFFGAPAQPWKTASYDKYDRDSYMLPEAYNGQNEYLGKTITKMIYDDETYYTQILMPIRFTNQMAVSWDVWTFNQTFTGMVPELGVSRLVTSHREQHSDTIVRRGLAARFEHGFMDTPEGRAHYFLTLAQIANAVRETLNFGVIYAYLTCHDYNKEWQAKHGYFKRETLQDMLRRENFMWAIAIKAEFGLEKLDSQIVEWMNVHRTSADTWVLPPKVASYLRLVPAEKVYYYLAGQEGPDRVNNIVSPGRPHEANKTSARTQDVVEPYAVFKKNNVFLTRSYHVENTGPIDLMNRVSSVGEFFKMVRGGDDDCNVGAGYMTCFNNRRIYNEDEDTGYSVTLMEALKNCMVFNDDGTPRALEGMEDPIDAADLEQVFWLRSETDATGRLLFKNIEIMGDIDPSFFPAESVANLARTMINSNGRLSKEQEKLDTALTEGAALVQYLANLPITVNSGREDLEGPGTWEEKIAGRTSLDGLRLISGNLDKAEGKIANAFVDALRRVNGELAPLLGGRANLLLNPANGRAGQTPEDVLYENLFGYGLVPLVATTAGQTDIALIRLNEALVQIGQATQKVFAKGAVTPAGFEVLKAEGVAEFLPLLQALNAKQNVNTVNAVLRFIEAHPIVVELNAANTTGMAAVSAWARQMQQALGKVGTSETVFSKITDLAISPNSRQLADNKLPAGFRRRSPFGLDDRAPNNLVFPAIITSHWEQTPIMQSILAQHIEGSAAGGRGDGGSGAARGFDSLFSDEDSFTGGRQARVGALFPGGADGQKAVDDLRARRSHVVDTGMLLNGRSDPRLRFGVLSRNLEQLNAFVNSGLERVVASTYFFAPWRRQTLESWLSRNIMPNFGIIGFRIGLYDMALGIKCKAGSQTAFTAFGNSRFMLADDATTMAHYGNFTFYGKSIVHKPEDVFIAYDIFPNKCLGGMGVRPYNHPSQYDAVQGIAMKDIFYCMVPYVEKDFATIMDMAGRFYTYMDAGMLDDEDPANAALHYSTAGWYNRLWRWHSEDDITLQIDQPLYAMSNPGQNRIVWQGAQGSYNALATGGYNYNRDIIRNKSPWGPDVFDGCKPSRNGEMERLRKVTDGILGF